jgi:hypothetical protein
MRVRAAPGTPATHFVAGDLTTREGLGIAEAVAYLVSDRAGFDIGANFGHRRWRTAAALTTA